MEEPSQRFVSVRHFPAGQRCFIEQARQLVATVTALRHGTPAGRGPLPKLATTGRRQAGRTGLIKRYESQARQLLFNSGWRISQTMKNSSRPVFSPKTTRPHALNTVQRQTQRLVKTDNLWWLPAPLGWLLSLRSGIVGVGLPGID